MQFQSVVLKLFNNSSSLKEMMAMMVFGCVFLLRIEFCQEPITRSVQLTYFRATAFSQVRLFLDTPFPPKIYVFECELVRLNPRFGFFLRFCNAYELSLIVRH